MKPVHAITGLSQCRTIFAALLLASALSACHRDAVPATAATAAGPAPAAPITAPVKAAAPVTPAQTPAQGVFILAQGQPVAIAPLTTLTFERVVNDSRCPAGVQCVWAGEVRIALVLVSPTGRTSFELASMGAQHASVQSMDFALLAFDACPANHAVGQAAAECGSVQVGKGPAL